MFVPNGAGAAEWHLGWDVEIPDGMFLLVLPAPAIPGLEVPSRVLDHRTLLRACEGEGISIAVRPKATVAVKRGDPVARVVLLDSASVTAKGTFEPFSSTQPTEDG